jgi:arylformamidase
MIDWDDAFDNSGYIAGAEHYADRWTLEAAAFRNSAAVNGQVELDLAYADSPRNRLDLFLPVETPAGLVVFVHGGYWLRLDKSYWSHLARGPLASGWAVAIPSYTLAPEARITGITQEIRAAIEFAAARVDGPIRLIGHSAGGHLVSRMVCDDSSLSAPVLKRLDKVVSVSGVHDLCPLTVTHMNETLRLTQAEAVSESPALHRALPDIDVTFWVGAAERPEFLRQTRLITEKWQRQQASVTDHYAVDRHHFSVIEDLGAPESALLLELIGDRAGH